MGIDFTGCEAIFESLKYVKNKQSLLTLGRQGIHITPQIIDWFLGKNNMPHLKNRYHGGFCESFFTDLGFAMVDSLDNSSYEGASIIHNMNQPISASFKKYDYILDAGTIEHIFNTSQVCENIMNLLNVDGIYVSITPNNNFSGHGIYQFSPEFYLSVFTKKYGMEIQELYLAQVGTEKKDWIDVNNLNKKGNGRNTVKLDTMNQVYIIAIIKKISNHRENCITNPPNQYSYQHMDWKNMNRYELVKNIVSNIQNGTLVEIGTHEGSFADHILTHSPTSTLYCIDPYISYNDYEDAINNITGDVLFQRTCNKLKLKYGERIQFIRKFSAEAISDIPSRIDFLYVDGNHSYKYVTQDLELYYPKVNDTCYIIGDDAVDHDDSIRNAHGDVLIHWIPGCYGNYGVIKAFKEFISRNSISGEIIGNQYIIKK